MGTIDISGKQVIRMCNNVSTEVVMLIIDSGNAKEYVFRLVSGVVSLVNIADDTDTITFTVT